MKRLCFFVVAASFVVACAGCASPLTEYVNAPDASFRWSVQSSEAGSEMKSAILSVTSQTWQGITWKHQVEMISPASPRRAGIALLIVTTGRPGGRESLVARLVAQRASCPAVVVYGIPNQPLFGDLREDALIAHTFKKTLETKDTTWPLLLPMTKSIVRAMDAVQAFAKRDWSLDVRGFVVTGASKRGWTTWLTAAADTKRVKAIVPVVYDNLNLSAQMAHQMRCYGAYSEQIGDYTALRLQDVLATPEGKALSAIVDPWEHRAALSMPKIIVNGANDPYWVVDSLNIYWSGLRGRNYIMYYANGGHNLGMEGAETLSRAERLAGAYEGLIKTLNAGPFPRLAWDYTNRGADRVLTVRAAEVKGAEAKLWTAASGTRDFRKSVWRSAAMEKTPSGWTASMPNPKTGYAAMFADVPVDFGGKRVILSTQIQVLGPGGPVEP